MHQIFQKILQLILILIGKQIQIDVNNAAHETSKIESNEDTHNVVVKSKEKNVEENLITDNDDKTSIIILNIIIQVFIHNFDQMR